MSVTGHRNVQSLASYVKPTDAEKRKISTILSSNEGSETVARINSVETKLVQQAPFPAATIVTPPTGNPSATQLNRLDMDHTLSFLTGQVSGSTINVNIYQKS